MRKAKAWPRQQHLLRQLLPTAGVIQGSTPQSTSESNKRPPIPGFCKLNCVQIRIEGSRIHHARGVALPAVAYARPHRLDIDRQPVGQPQFCATIAYIHAAGPVVKIELTTPAGTAVHVEMPQERYQSLGLQRGAQVFVTVKELKVFTASHNAMI